MQANGEMREHLGAHDVYEPVVLSRVYFLLDAEACQIKIGYTTQLRRRVRAWELRRGRPLELLGTLRGGKPLERACAARPVSPVPA